MFSKLLYQYAFSLLVFRYDLLVCPSQLLWNSIFDIIKSRFFLNLFSIFPIIFSLEVEQVVMCFLDSLFFLVVALVVIALN